MPINVDRTGVFRCKLLEHGIAKTREKGYPQLILRVALTELYDKDTIDEAGQSDGWCNITDWDMETQGYICLYGIKKKETVPSPTLGYDQVMKVFEWDGQSLAELAQGGYEGLEFQVRIGENNYEGAKYPFQVDWIDVYDADPVYTIKKLDPDEVKALDAQFSNVVASAKKAASAVKKPAPAKVKKPTPANKQQEENKPLTEADKKKKLKEKSDRIKAEAKKLAPPPPDEEQQEETPKPNVPALPEINVELTKQEAWERVFEARDPSIDDETVKELWKAAIKEVGGENATSKDLNGKQWAQVFAIVIADCGKL